MSGSPARAEDSRPIDLRGHQLPERLVRFAAGEHGFGVCEAAAIGLGQINPAAIPVAGHVLAEVGQLQAGADRIGESYTVGGVAAGQIQHQSADRIGRAAQ